MQEMKIEPGGWPGTMGAEPSVSSTTTAKAAKEVFWVKTKHLVRASTISAQNMRQIKVRNKKYKGVWDFFMDKVDMNSIPEKDRVKYFIPNNERLAALVDDYKRQEQDDELKGYSRSGHRLNAVSIYNKMLDAIEDYHKHYNHINAQYNLRKEVCRETARKWAVWEWIMSNYANHGKRLTAFYTAYNLIFPGHLESENSFGNFMRAILDKGIEKKVIDHRAIAKKEKRIPKGQHALLQSLYIQPQKINAAGAYRKLVTACIDNGEKAYSLASVKKYFREFENNTELYTLRYGAAAAQKQQPYASLLPAEHRNTQWQMDGWTLPFWGFKFQRYVVYLIRDNHSRKIIGYSVAASENTAMILEAIESAMANTGVFPAELVCDKHSFTKTEIAGRLRAETERMGGIWTVTVNAQRNQIAERYNQYLDEKCKDYPGYTGKNVTAKGKNARPSAETMTENARPGNWKTEDEVKTIAAYIITEYNRTGLNVLGGQSPNDAYDASEDKKCFVLTEAERLKLLRPIQCYLVRRGQIDISVGSKKYEYQLPTGLIEKYNNRKLTVVYEDLEQGIYISDPESGEDLGSIGPKPKVRGAVADQTEDDKQYLLKMVGRKKGVTTRARRDAQQAIKDGLQANPDAVGWLEQHTLPKDIRQMAEQDRELKRAMADTGINPNMLPIREAKATTLPPERVKTKDRPFAPAENELRVLSPYEIAGEE